MILFVKYFDKFFILAIIVCQLISLIDLTNGQQHANSLIKKQTKGNKQTDKNPAENLGKKIGIRERYYTKNYGKLQFDKYRGQIPSKGATIDCVVECFSLATCHCLGINIHNNECHFYGLQSELSLDSNTWNATYKDYLFFTRDIYLNSDDLAVSKVDILAGRKIMTSANLDGKSKQPKTSKSSKMIISSMFPIPWIQIEFKEPMYITEIFLRSAKGVELKKFQIRVGDESIAKAYSAITPGGYDPEKDSAQPFEQNSICYQHFDDKKNFFSPKSSKQKQPLDSKSVRCQPCGLVGKFLTIQTFEPCPSCVVDLMTNQSTIAGTSTTTTTKPNQPGKISGKSKSSSLDAKLQQQQQFPIPIESIEIYGYSTSERKHNTA